ncbi:MAG: hypothetical protein WDN27_03080 [Candidatus Saccharibacteria bacterium]
MEKREIAEAYLDWLGLSKWLVAEMFSMGSDDPELSNAYGNVRLQAYILCDRYLGIESPEPPLTIAA